MHKGVIIEKKAKLLVPDGAFENALKAAPTVFGAAIHYDGKLDVQATDAPVTLAELKEMQESFKDCSIMMYFGAFPQGFHGDDIQPFVLLSEGDDHQIVGLYDGEFIGFDQEKSNHSPTFFFNNEIVQVISQYKRLASGDFKKIMEEMKNPLFKKQIEMSSPKYHDITFFAANGEVLNFSHGNANAGVFPWGRMSNNCGYSEGEAKKPDEVKKPGGLAGLFGNRKTAAAAPTADAKTGNVVHTIGEKNEGAAIRSAVPAVKPVAAATATATPKLSKTDKYVIQIPPNLSREDKKKFIKTHNIGKFPNNWMELDCILVDPKGRSRTLRAFSDLGPALQERVMDENGDGQIETKPVETPAASPVETPKPQDQPSTPDVKPVDDVPVISAQGKKALEEFMKSKFFKNAVDASSNAIPNPAEISAAEKKYPSFAEQTGVSIGDFSRWKFPVRVAFAKECPEAAAVLLGNMSGSIMSMAASAAIQPHIPAKDTPAVAEKPASTGALGGLFRRKTA